MRRCILLFSCTLMACVSAHAARLTTGPALPPVPVDSARVFLTAEQVRVPYDEIAIVSAQDNIGRQDEAIIVNALRKKAAALGADGLILESQSQGVKSADVSVSVNNGALLHGRAIAIRLHPAAKIP